MPEPGPGSGIQSGREPQPNLVVRSVGGRHDPRMAVVPTHPPYDRFLVTGEQAAAARPGVDPSMVREIFEEVATLLHDGLVLDGLDEHDAGLVVDGLCADLVAADPGAAIRARADAVLTDPGDLHDPEEAWSAYLTTVQLFGI